MTARRPHQARALAILGLACVVWGLGFPLTKALVLALEARGAVAGVPAWQAAGAPVAVRFALAAVVLLVAASVGAGGLRRFRRDEWAQGGLLGALGGVTVGLHVAASQTTDASAIAFLSQLYCVLVVLAAAVEARRRPSGVVWASLGLVVGGAAVLSGLEPRSLSPGPGEGLALLSALTIAAQIHVLGLPRYRGNEPTRVSLAMCLAAAAVLGPALLGTGGAVAARCLFDPDLLALNLILGFVVTGLLFWLMNRFQPEVGTVEAGVIYTTEPVWAALGALTLPPLLSAWLAVPYAAEPFSPRLALGGALIVAANVLLQLHLRRDAH